MSNGRLDMPERFERWLEWELQRRLSAIEPTSPRPAQARYQAVVLNRRHGMFRMTKLKLAVAIATGALALGAAGAYAAGTVTVQNPQSFKLGSGSNVLTLVPLNGAQPIKASDLPKWTNAGECVSFFAGNRNYALAPAGTLGTTLTLKKSYHGKLVSFVASTWCKTQVTSPSISTKASTSTAESQPEGPPAWAHNHGAGKSGHGILN
jgi:hypothetical protein